jgi:hypothetical protein
VDQLFNVDELGEDRPVYPVYQRKLAGDSAVCHQGLPARPTLRQRGIERDAEQVIGKNTFLKENR